jgi:hypothetical protein
MNFVNFVIVFFASIMIGKIARLVKDRAQILNFGTTTRANQTSTFYPIVLA